MGITFDIPPCLKAGDSCSWFHERTYFIRLPSKAAVHLSPSVPSCEAVP
jgi:hypothetical protein